MSAADTPKFVKVTQEEFDTTFNRIQLALAKHENVVKSWTAKSSRKEPTKTQGQLEAEDAALFRNEPPYLGVGAPIPANFLVSDAERNNKSLRAKFFPTKGLKASKPRDFEEKAASAKRALKEESSDDEGGRSSLGKAKKIKTIKAEPAPSAEAMHKTKHSSGGNERYSVKGGNLDVTMEGNGDNTLATPPTTPEKTATTTETEPKAEERMTPTENYGSATDQTEIAQVQEQKEEYQEEAFSAKPMNKVDLKMRANIQKHKAKKKMYRKTLKQRKRQEANNAKLAFETGQSVEQVS